MDISARRLQQLCDDGGGGGLAVAAGDGDHVAGADLKEHLHLAGEGTALPLRRQQLRHVRPQARCAEDNVLRQAVQIPLPQMERGSGGLQLIGQRTATVLWRSEVRYSCKVIRQSLLKQQMS